MGLSFALAGYLVHDIHAQVPFLRLDSMEPIASLIEYFADYAEYLVVALLSEEPQPLNDDYTHIYKN